MAHAAGAYPGFCGTKQLGVFILLPPEWDVSPSQGCKPPAVCRRYPFIHLDEERQCQEQSSLSVRKQHSNAETNQSVTTDYPIKSPTGYRYTTKKAPQK